MAMTTQAGNVDAITALTGLTHDIFIGEVVNNVKRESPTAQLFNDAQAGEYRLEGQNMIFAADFRFITGALATDGKLPDHVGMDAVQGKLTPIRRYKRLATDNFVERRAMTPGAFQNLAERLYDQLWAAWKSMEIRHSIGDSTGLLAKVSSRTSSTIVVLTAGYGNAGTNPIMHIAEGSILAWYDVSAAQIGGAAKVSSINYTTNAVTLDSATTWETTVGNIIAADDLIYFATTSLTTRDHFVSERNLAPNGIGTIVDPAAALSTVFNIAEATYQRSKPYRTASATFDHLEVLEHWLQLGAKRGFAVTPATDVCLTHPAVVAQLARSLMGFQQQAYTGGQLEGGYTGVRVGGIDFVQDQYFYHNVMVTLLKDGLFRVPLGEQADFFGEDGAQWSRIADFDGKEAFVRDYLNFLDPNRGANGALTSIVTPDITDTQFDPVPNY